jgi:transcriptional regulator with XRE-family HTH domain
LWRWLAIVAETARDFKLIEMLAQTTLLLMAKLAQEDRPDTQRERDRRSLGKAIRRLRQQQGRTLSDVAGEAGISTSLLSQVENGLVDPSLDSLRDIADALGTAPFKLHAARALHSRVVRGGEGRPLSLPDSDVELYLLSPSMDEPFEVVRWTLKDGGVTSRERRGHPGVEGMFILDGRVEIEVGDETIELRAGDFLTIDASSPHRARALDGSAEGMFILSPPAF